MNEVFSKFSCRVIDLIDDYVFRGMITINSAIRENSIEGVILLNELELDSIFIRINFDNNTISKQTATLNVEHTPKEIVNQFIDRFITESNRLYSAYITALNS